MPSFDEHIFQAKENLIFLEEINKNQSHWDWQVTVCFYTSLHLINAHLSKYDYHFEKHKKVLNLINPFQDSSVKQKLNQNDFLAYRTLFGLSMRARYLCNHKEKDDSNKACYTNEIHFNKAIKHLDTIMKFSENELKVEFPNKYRIESSGLNYQILVHFTKTE